MFVFNVICKILILLQYNAINTQFKMPFVAYQKLSCHNQEGGFIKNSLHSKMNIIAYN